MKRAILATAAIFAAGPAYAQAPLAGHADEVVVRARRPVVVTAQTCPEPDPSRHPAERPPAVADSYPARGADVAPGYVRVRVSFDQPMSCYSEVMVDGGEGDPCQPDGTWVLPDRRSWLMICRFAPATPVRIRFERIDGRGFVGLSGRPADRYVLDFTTTDAAQTETAEASAALDPGPPGAERAATALVTCADTRRTAVAGRDCRRQAYAPPR